MVGPIDDALRRAAAAAEAYGVPEAMTAVTASNLARLAGAGRTGIAMHALHEAVLIVAESHRSECDEGDCATCDAIRNSLVVALAVIRTEVDAEFDVDFPD